MKQVDTKSPGDGRSFNGVSDRAAGAVMGALIEDAVEVGPHWYYDLDEMRRDYGEWITGYTDPQPHRYHAGLKAGQLSQAGPPKAGDPDPPRAGRFSSPDALLTPSFMAEAALGAIGPWIRKEKEECTTSSGIRTTDY